MILLAPLQTSPATTAIIPGQRIGRAVIDGTVASVGAGAPTRARGSDIGAWSTWVVGGSRLDIWSVEYGEEMVETVRIARTTSAGFVLPNGLRVGVSEARMRRAFPRAKSLGTYLPPWRGANVRVWDDVKGGLAFETVRGKCLAIAVHPRGTSVLGLRSDYLSHLQTSIYKK